jgi:hypothetical protein
MHVLVNKMRKTEFEPKQELGTQTIDLFYSLMRIKLIVLQRFIIDLTMSITT